MLIHDLFPDSHLRQCENRPENNWRPGWFASATKKPQGNLYRGEPQILIAIGGRTGAKADVLAEIPYSAMRCSCCPAASLLCSQLSNGLLIPGRLFSHDPRLAGHAGESGEATERGLESTKNNWISGNMSSYRPAISTW